MRNHQANGRNATAEPFTLPSPRACEAATVSMTSFINTMFVHNSPPQPYDQSPKPLPALHSNVLAESESCSSLQYPSSPEAAYASPLQRHIQETYFYDSKHTTCNIPVPVHVENRTHDVHRWRQHIGLDNGLGDIGREANLLTFASNANARTRNQAFQPQKRAKGTNSWQLKQFAEATLGSGSLRKVVQLPEGEDRDEWLAVNGITEHRVSLGRLGPLTLIAIQWSTSTTRSTSYMAPSLSSAHQPPALR